MVVTNISKQYNKDSTKLSNYFQLMVIKITHTQNEQMQFKVRITKFTMKSENVIHFQSTSFVCMFGGNSRATDLQTGTERVAKIKHMAGTLKRNEVQGAN